MSPASKRSTPREEQNRLARRKDCLWLRARLIQEIRRFFVERGYLEVETPQLLRTPPPEVHIDLIPAGDGFLRSSPELCMKRLQAAGWARIFQIGKCFRDGERGDFHLPEFTLLEWYRAGTDYRGLMTECERLLRQVSRCIIGGERIRTQGRDIELSGRWHRISVRECFSRYAAVDLETAIRKGCFEEVMVRDVEPNLGERKPTILYDYPAALASLARLNPEAPKFAERFEIYIAGVEIANGFSELTDPIEQRRRFEKERQARERFGKPTYPMPEKFLKSLADMPESAGIALGVDRLAMIFADRSKIDDVVCFTPEEL